MSTRIRTYKLEDWPLLGVGLFLSLLTFALFIGFNLLDRGFIIDVWTNISYSTITISNLIKTMSGIYTLMLTFIILIFNFFYINNKTLMNLDNKYS